jgi:hypothetical protein
MCMCIVCLLQPEHYKWPPVERCDCLSMSVTGGQLIYNAQLVNDDYYTQSPNHNCKVSGNFTKYAILLYIRQYSSMQLCSENSCDFD